MVIEMQNLKIVENQYLKEMDDIFEENHQEYLSLKGHEKSIYQLETIKLACLQKNEVVGYLILYLGKDFCKQEEFPIQIENNQEKVGYIWALNVKKLKKEKELQHF